MIDDFGNYFTNAKPRYVCNMYIPPNDVGTFQLGVVTSKTVVSFIGMYISPLS